MNKIPRYMKEYASSKCTSIGCNELMKAEFKKEKIEKIGRTLDVYSRGLITTDEAMRSIAEA